MRHALVVALFGSLSQLACSTKEREGAATADATTDADESAPSTECCPYEPPTCGNCTYMGGVKSGAACPEYCNVSGEGSTLVVENGCVLVKLAPGWTCDRLDAAPSETAPTADTAADCPTDNADETTCPTTDADVGGG